MKSQAHNKQLLQIIKQMLSNEKYKLTQDDIKLISKFDERDSNESEVAVDLKGLRNKDKRSTLK